MLQSSVIRNTVVTTFYKFEKRAGKLKINIADMQVGRTQEGGQALMALTVDSVIPKEVIEVITKETGASLVRFVNLVSE